ncbi:hypothetical protein RI129_008538 [Pyrocoelia pectoralis]|uniref:Uncharacterized protein n=1 Tax=Pyrocoelia pectoralis TaxID=417401 RepID=A0AAN7VBA1_9COLE
MNSFVVILACLVVCASAKPSGLWGHGLVGVLGHGYDDGQWHGEGLLESQDWEGHGAHVVGALGHGLVHGHGAVVAGPAGAIFAHAHHGAVIGHHGHW